MQRIIVCLVVFIFIPACAWFDKSAVTYSDSELILDFSDGIVFELLPPDSFGRSLTLTQSASIDFEGNTIDLLFYLEITQDKIVIVGVLPVGTRLFTIIYDGQSILSEGHEETLQQVQAKYLIADLQFSLWPLDKLVAQFQSSSDCFQTNLCSIYESQEQDFRYLTSLDNEILKVSYTGDWLEQGEILYQNFTRAYTLQLSTLEVGFE